MAEETKEIARIERGGQMMQVEITDSDLQRTYNNMEKIRQFIAKALKPKIHFYEIKTKDGKTSTSLSKAGAELVLNLYNCYSRVNKETKTALEDGHFRIDMEVEIIHRPSGNVVGYGVGAGSSKEYRMKYAKYNPDEVYNSVRKQTFKRCTVDGTLYLANISEHYTQDMEDMEEGMNNPEPNPATILIQKDTAEKIRKFTNDHEVDPEVVKTHLKARYNQERMVKITEKDGRDFMDFLTKTFTRTTSDMGGAQPNSGEPESEQDNGDQPQDAEVEVGSSAPDSPDPAYIIGQVEGRLKKYPAIHIKFAKWFKIQFPTSMTMKDLSLDGAQACLDWFEEQIKEHNA